MAYGLPCVLSELAAEGTGLSHGISALIADTPDAWVNAIIRLYDDQELWHKFSENEQILAKEKYSFEHGVNEFRKILASVELYS